MKSVEQQALQALHRSRSAWMATRTARINTLRGFCREFGIAVSQGSRLGLEQMARQLADPASGLPELLRPTMRLLIEEIRLLETRISQLEKELAQLGAAVARVHDAADSTRRGPAHRHRHGGGHQWRGDALQGRTPLRLLVRLTPKESSSGMTRRLGRISKRGDRYLRMLLTHGARSVLRAATVADRQGRSVDALRRWALTVQSRTHHNRATCALANKMARICYAVLRDHQDYGSARIERKMRQTYALPS